MKSLFKWSKKYIPHLILITILLFSLEWLYSYLSKFVGFAIALINDEPTEGLVPSIAESWIVSVKSTDGVMKAVLFSSICLIGIQFVRSIMRFTSNYLSGAITQNIARDMRVKFYDRVTDSDGRAILNIRLGAAMDTYIITSSYNGTNIANKITIVP
jgi:ABC-type multidrug transport system fused ATPase/permease subunit